MSASISIEETTATISDKSVIVGIGNFKVDIIITDDGNLMATVEKRSDDGLETTVECLDVLIPQNLDPTGVRAG